MKLDDLLEKCNSTISYIDNSLKFESKIKEPMKQELKDYINIFNDKIDVFTLNKAIKNNEKVLVQWDDRWNGASEPVPATLYPVEQTREKLYQKSKKISFYLIQNSKCGAEPVGSKWKKYGISSWIIIASIDNTGMVNFLTNDPRGILIKKETFNNKVAFKIKTLKKPEYTAVQSNSDIYIDRSHVTTLFNDESSYTFSNTVPGSRIHIASIVQHGDCCGARIIHKFHNNAITSNYDAILSAFKKTNNFFHPGRLYNVILRKKIQKSSCNLVEALGFKCVNEYKNANSGNILRHYTYIKQNSE